MRNFILCLFSLLIFSTTYAQVDSWVNLQIQFDNYPEEIEWRLFQLDTVSANNLLIAEGGPYNTAPNQSIVNEFIPGINSNETYILEFSIIHNRYKCNHS